MERTETFQITDIAAFADRLSRLSEHNPDFDLTKKELLEKGLVGVRIYENLYPCEEVTLVPGRYPSAAKEDAAPQAESDGAEEEAAPQDKPDGAQEEAAPQDKPDGTEENAPQNEETDDGCLLVQVSRETVGYIRKASYPHLRALLEEGAIVSLSLTLHGGAYRMLFEDGDLQEGHAGYFGLLEVLVREKENEKAASGDTPGTMHYISTSYDTLLLEQGGRRGNAALLLGGILGAFYLGFSIPYWIMIRRGLIAPSAFLGGDLPNNLLNPHMALVIAATASSVAAMLIKNCLAPLIAGILFAVSAWTLPGYALFTAPSAILCMICAQMRKSGRLPGAVRALLLVAVLALQGWLLRDTAVHFWNSKSFMIRPTGTEEEAPPQDGYDGSDGGFFDTSDDEAGYDEGFDEGFDEDFEGDAQDFEDDFAVEDGMGMNMIGNQIG